MLYDSIHNLPIRVWKDIHDDGNLMRLYTGPFSFFYKLFYKKKMKRIFSGIYREYIKEIGFESEFLERKELESRIAALKVMYTETGDSFLINEILVLEDQLKPLQAVGDTDIFDNMMYIERLQGVPVLTNERLTVHDYYRYLKNLIKEGRNAKKNRS